MSTLTFNATIATIDPMPAETLIFLHLPKTAGTTLHRILDREYPAEEIFTIQEDAHADIARFKALPAGHKANLKLLRGHMGFGLHQQFAQRCRYFTMLRDPVERVISYYYFILRQPTHYLYQAIQENQWDLKQLLESGLPLMMDNGQTRLLSGVWGERPFGQVGEIEYTSARRNLDNHFAVIGLQEAFDTSLLLYQKEFGWQRIEYRRQNTTQNRPRQAAMTPETIDLIKRYNRQDFALYNYAAKRFADMVRAQPALFKLRATFFPAENWCRHRYWELRKISVRQLFRSRHTE